jgi:hypothetical protein
VAGAPLGPTGYGDSPYQYFSAPAGTPLLIALDALDVPKLLFGVGQAKIGEHAAAAFGDALGVVLVMSILPFSVVAFRIGQPLPDKR